MRPGRWCPSPPSPRAEWAFGAPKLERFNGVGSFQIQGNAAPGSSTGAAMAEMERLAAQLPPGTGVDWSGLSYEERASGSQAAPLYALSLLVVFLCLAALYESWAIPAAVMMAVPLGVLGAVTATWGFGMANELYFQVGLLTTVASPRRTPSSSWNSRRRSSSAAATCWIPRSSRPGRGCDRS
ncbi:efflux RND transporter permease subunit [Roseococcus sp.]|uniref:efflux RND transporter permease subunit n=1 Tax=Roseococcus sp. TaxID=2109646 RepID=UPI003BAB723E